MKYPIRPTWLEIDLAVIRQNVRHLRRYVDADCNVMSVVKANAYGHGAVQIAKTVLDAGAQRLAVAAFCEASDLRAAGIGAPILVLGYTPPWQAQEAVAADVTLTIYDMECATALNSAASQANQMASVHVKINTGMNRLGISTDDAHAFLSAMRRYPNLRVEGIYTHFATADEVDKQSALEQFHRFERLLDALRAADLCPPVAHAANSAATLALPQTHLQMVRPGIALYGLHPDVEKSRLPTEFRPALSWKASIVQVRKLQPGDAIGYGREFIARHPMQIAVLPMGYADGFSRAPHHWGSVLIGGKPAPILGRVCMDHTMVDITSHAVGGVAPRQGDEAVLIGRQEGTELSADTIGERLRTINYDVVSRIQARVPRVYVE